MTIELGPVMLDVAGLDITREEREIIAHPQVGGVIAFARNYQNPEQLIDWVRQLREVKPHLLIAADHEGGRVQRFKTGLTRIPDMFSLATQKPEWLLPVGELMALELLALGADFSFAPVLDRFNPDSKVIGDRAFAEKPQHIAKLAEQLITGFSKAGMAAVGKHFPGHGYVAEDTHLEGAIDPRPLAEISESDLLPFKALASELEGMMPAHVVFPEVDENPVGFSKTWLQTVLRQELGFNGAIFSDDLTMAAAKAYGNPLERGSAALDAGCDMVLMCNAPSDAITLIEGLEGENYRVNSTHQARLLALSARKTRAQQNFHWAAVQKTPFWQRWHGLLTDWQN